MGWACMAFAFALSIAFNATQDFAVGATAAVFFVGAQVLWKLEDIKSAISRSSK